jgi:hypothetical protein
MNIYPKLRKPFIFWLAQQLLPTETKIMHNKSIGNNEFYTTMAMVAIALIVMSIVFQLISK